MSRPVSTKPPEPPPAFGKNPWLPYTTDVDPGSGIQFVGASVGWRLEGKAIEPYIDGNLVAGPSTAIVDWPGTTLARSADGGATWSRIFSKSDGIWGFQLLSPTIGWAVGVTSLSGTTDGGKTWRALGEPMGTHLVKVDFTSASDGFGLTTTGGLVATTDGGTSWTADAITPPPSMAVSAADLCFTSAARGFVIDTAGDIYATDSAGARWTKSYSTMISSTDPMRWDSLSCGGGGVWASTEIIGEHGPTPYIVAHGTDSHQPGWSIVAARSMPGLASKPAATVNVLGGVAAQPGDVADLIGLPATGFRLVVAHTSGSTAAYSSQSLPALDENPADGRLASQPGAYLRVDGVSFVGEDGWIWLTDSGVGDRTTPAFETVLLTTSDGGQTWRLLDKGPRETQPVRPPLTPPAS